VNIVPLDRAYVLACGIPLGRSNYKHFIVLLGSRQGHRCGQRASTKSGTDVFSNLLVEC
jgi:hypothetical protein